MNKQINKSKNLTLAPSNESKKKKRKKKKEEPWNKIRDLLRAMIIIKNI